MLYVTNIEELARTLISDLGSGFGCVGGDLSSNYFTLAEMKREETLTASVSLLHCKIDADTYYTVHLVDDVNSSVVELYCTETDDKEELMELLESIARDIAMTAGCGLICWRKFSKNK